MKSFHHQHFPLSAALASIAMSMIVSASAQTPFNAFSYVAPCTIECEQYDQGGSGVAYSVVSSCNVGGKYRTDAVSIYTCSRLSGTTGYCIGNLAAGNWLDYHLRGTGL